MKDEAPGRIADVRFASGAAAGRRVAGVAAAARIVRELAEAGFTEARLVGPGGTIGDRAWRDVRRLAGGMKIEVTSGQPDPLEGAEIVPGDRLIPADRLRAGTSADFNSAGIALDRGAAMAILRGTAKASDGPVSRWLNRPVSRRLSALLLRVPGMRPLHATIGTGLLALAMFAFLVGGGEGGLVAGALLFQAASVFDGVDGEIARATFRASHVGALLDNVVDVATNMLLVIGLTLNLAWRGSEQAAALSAWGFVLFAAGLSIITWRAARTHGPLSLDLVKHQYRRRFPSAAAGAVIQFLTVVSSRDFFALLFAVLIVAGFPMAVLYLFAAAATVWILFVLGSIRLPAHPSAAGRIAEA
jgi:1L-myo-inositol 1-phosphate cytidylyltransferase / CDP-L-myo-inositol myo-inositolphosphotransferase